MGLIAQTPLFTHLVHADWSKRPQGRWMARASMIAGRWRVSTPAPVGAIDAFLDALFDRGESGPLLAGFDFPIGLPMVLATKIGFRDFPAALQRLGSGDWTDFYRVAETPGEIGPRRPFYPLKAGPKGTVRRQHLVDGLGVASFADLSRRCETRPSTGGRAASMMLWTLGAAAVGKAVIHGWQEVVAPARRRGAHLWPFDGSDLAVRPGVTIAETYPGDAFNQMGLSFAGRSKTRPSDRQSAAASLLDWTRNKSIDLDPGLKAAIEAGFGPGHGNDNGFDAVLGLFAMIGVVSGLRPYGAPSDEAITRWEGWILGRET